MKIMISIISAMIILAGILPILGGFGMISESIPTEGTGYSIIIIGIGVFGLIYAFINRLLMGPEKFVTIVVALLTILGGILPLISELITSPIPTSGPIYSGLIIIIGAIGLVYGIMGIG